MKWLDKLLGRKTESKVVDYDESRFTPIVGVEDKDFEMNGPIRVYTGPTIDVDLKNDAGEVIGILTMPDARSPILGQGGYWVVHEGANSPWRTVVTFPTYKVNMETGEVKNKKGYVLKPVREGVVRISWKGKRFTIPVQELQDAATVWAGVDKAIDEKNKEN